MHNGTHFRLTRGHKMVIRFRHNTGYFEGMAEEQVS